MVQFVKLQGLFSLVCQWNSACRLQPCQDIDQTDKILPAFVYTLTADTCKLPCRPRACTRRAHRMPTSVLANYSVNTGASISQGESRRTPTKQDHAFSSARGVRTGRAHILVSQAHSHRPSAMLSMAHERLRLSKRKESRGHGPSMQESDPFSSKANAAQQ